MGTKAKKGRKSARSSAAHRSRRWPWVLLILFLIVFAVAYYFRVPASGYAQTATAYSARVACSCRFVAGRDLDDCKKDRLGGMELVTLVEDADAKSVTARFPLITSDTASYRKGFGCVLEKWDD
ncbi:MAG: hypothetical protein ABJ242_03280 [Marinomonas sp.]